MALSKHEGLEQAYSPDSSSGFSLSRRPNPQIDLRTKMAHMYDGQSLQRGPTVLVGNSGRVIGGTGGNARQATIREIFDVLNGEIHHPTDEESLKREPQHRRGLNRASGRGNDSEEPGVKADTECKAIARARKQREIEAKKARNCGNGKSYYEKH